MNNKIFYGIIIACIVCIVFIAFIDNLISDVIFGIILAVGIVSGFYLIYKNKRENDLQRKKEAEEVKEAEEAKEAAKKIKYDQDQQKIQEQKVKENNIRELIKIAISNVQTNGRDNSEIIEDLFKIYIKHVSNKDKIWIDYYREFIQFNDKFNFDIKNAVRLKIIEEKKSKYPKIDYSSDPYDYKNEGNYSGMK